MVNQHQKSTSYFPLLSAAGLDYVAQSGLQLEVSPTVSLLTVVLALLDDGEIESLEQLTVTVEPAEGEVGVIISQPDTEVFIVSDDGKKSCLAYIASSIVLA